MHLLMLGANGRAGVFGYKYALDQGYTVTVLVRKAESIEPHENLTIIEGSCLSETDMKRAFAATGLPVDGVLIFLNARRNGQNPWGKFLGPARLVADTTCISAKLLRAQQPQPEHKPRLVVMSALGVKESYAVTPYIIRFMINYSNLDKSYDDHNAVRDEIEANCGDEVDWTLPLPVGLIFANGLKPVRTFGPTESGANLLMTRESCASWMVDVASGKEGDRFRNQMVIVSN
ncbi:hypothetical protein N7528_006738 [Penicillium herquei]|nr:hypothetical protein N7528_006738 [Penicillium herquei]